MINVPERVKDALRSGEYRKNVNINMYQVIPEHEEQLDDISVERSYSNVFRGTYDFDGFEEGDTFKFKYPTSGAFSSLTIYITGQNPRQFTAISSDSETYIQLTYATAYDNATFSFEGVSVVPAGTDTANFEVWLHVAEKTIKTTIDNNKLVAESVKFDERMCSDTELKFGLCEGTSVEFQYFDFPNIRGEQIEITIDIEYKDSHGELMWYTIPMGWYEVKECSRQASTGIIKATAFNKLQSDYLDKDVLAEVYSYVVSSTGTGRSISDILNYLLNGYHIEKTDWDEVSCQLWRDANPEDGIYGGWNWISIYYWNSTSGTWAEYKKDQWTQEYPYQYPSGCRFVLYSADFYFKAVGDTGSSTTHHYKYDAIQMQAIWNIVRKNLVYFYDYNPYLIPSNLITRVANPLAVEPYMPSSDPHFGLNGGEGGIDFTDYGPRYATDNDPDNRVSGFFGDVSWETGTSVAGHSEPVNYGEFTGSYPCLRVPIAIVVQKDDYIGFNPPVPFVNQDVWNKVLEKYEETYQALCGVILPKMYKKRLSPIEEEVITASQIRNLQSLTLRDLQSAAFEIDCQYGKLDRESDLFAGIELNNARLYPADNLYPADDLFPMGTAEAGYPSMYSKLWADEGNVRSFRYLYVTYKGTDNGQEVEKVIQRTVDANGTDDYNMSDNWLFKNLVWSDADVGAYADAMVAKMQNIRWFPFEMWCAGLPYLEAGDEIEIAMKEGTYPSYILRRTLSGIQNLQDELIDGTLDIF